MKRRREHFRQRPSTTRDGTKFKAILVATGQTVCHYCNTDCGDEITADHRNPLARGGKDEFSNIVPACFSCNQRKGSKTYADFMEIITLERMLSNA